MDRVGNWRLSTREHRAEMTTEQDLSENHIRVLLHRLHNAVDKKEWEEVVELASELELVASKQARDYESYLDKLDSQCHRRYGRRNGKR